MATYRVECPKCAAPVQPGLGHCDRCRSAFDPWTEPPPAIAALLAGGPEVSPDFPTITRHLVEVSRLVERRETSVQDLANAVLRDMALTTRLLRLVNGAFWRSSYGAVATLTRAVMLLGFEEVRRATMALILFDRLRDHPRGSALATRAVAAFGAGLIARSVLARDSGSSVGEPVEPALAEEAFIVGMYQRLGSLSLDAFLPTYAERVQNRRGEGFAPDEAHMLELDCTSAQLGGAVARAFGLPEVVARTQRALPAGVLAPPRDTTEHLHYAAAFGVALIDEATTQEKPDFGPLLERFGGALSLTEIGVRSVLASVVRQLWRHAADLDIDPDESEWVRRLLAWAAPPTSESGPGASAESGAGRGARRPARDETEDRRRGFLAQGIDELKVAVQGGAPVNEVLSLVAETAWRGFGFTHVALCLRHPEAAELLCRIALGPQAAELRRRLSVQVPRARDVFSRAVHDGLDQVVDDLGSPFSRLPPWYPGPLAARGLVLFPVRVQGRTVALLYGDSEAPAVCFQRSRFLHLREMRDLAEGALERHRRHMP